MENIQSVRFADGAPFDITERLRTEEELRLTQFSLEHASDAIFWTDPQGCILYVNEAACRALERSREELLSLTVLDIHPHFSKADWGTFWEKVKSRGSLTLETEHQTKQGRVFPVEVTANYLEFDGKEYAFAFARDITERKAMEESLREGEDRYRRLFEVESDAILVADCETGRILDANGAALKLYGYSREEFLLLTAEEVSSEPEKTRTAIADRRPSVQLRWHRQKDGTIFPVEIALNYFVNQSRSILVAAIRDVTERQRAEEAMRRSETKFRALYESSTDAVMLLDAKGFFDCNPAALVIFGCATREEICSFHPADLSPPLQPCGTDSLTLANQHIALATQKGANHFEWVHKRTDTGDTFAADVLLCAMKLDGKPVLQAVVRDITERKRADEALTLALIKSQRQEKEVAALLEGARAVLDGATFGETARAIFTACQGLFGTPAGYVALLSSDGTENEVVFLEAGGMSCTVDPSLRMPIRGLRAEAYRTGEAVFDNDFANSKWMELMPRGHAPLQNVMFTPLLVQGKTVGLMGLANKPGGFTDADATISMAFGKLIAIALDKSRNLEALRASEERFRSFFQEAAEGMLVSNFETQRFVYANPAVCRMLGYTEDELVHMGVSDLHPQQDWEKVVAGCTAQTHGERKPATAIACLCKDGKTIYAEVNASRLEAGGKDCIVGFFTDITERKCLEAALESAARLPQENPDPVLRLSQGRIIDFANASAYNLLRIWGRDLGEEVPPEIAGPAMAAMENGTRREAEVTYDGQTYLASLCPVPDANYVNLYAKDITERKRAERHQSLSAEILGILNEPLGVSDGVNRILEAIKRETGFDAVGIRLRSGDDFPYFAQSGFSDGFLLTENTLIARDKDGGPCRDKDGNISLECTCGLVLSGKTDPANPLFTKGGSCWTNNSLPLLELPAHQDPRLNPRNKCVHQGYCSVALIPIRTHRGIVGLLQLNDRKKSCFTLEMIQFFEGISASIGVALMRKQQEDALRDSESRLRVITDSAQDAILMMDPQGRVSFWNPAAERMLGYTSAEAIGQDLHALIVPPRYHAAHQAAFPAFRQTGQGPVIGKTRDLEARRKDGKEIPIQLSLSAIQINGGWHAVGILGDITVRKRAEQTRSQLAAIVESSDDAIIGKTLEGVITSWNGGAQRLYGFTPEEAVGQPISIVIPPEGADELERILETIRSEHRIERMEAVRLRKDGGKVDVSLTISPIKNGEGKVAGAATIAHDITESKQAEEALSRYASDLESARSVQEENAARLRQLVEDLGEAKGRAEAATQAKSQFLANMSHEIRTPMNGVIGMAGLLLGTDLTPEQQRYAEIVRTSGEALMVVINDILDFSKIEARKLVLEITDFDLRLVLEYAAAVLAIKASEKGLELTCDLELGIPCLLRGDPGRVRQVLVNLLGNAVKFTHQGEVSIRVRLDAEDERGATLRFTVSDTGIGFRQDRAAALFAPFVQADGSTTRRYGGTGLGLAISKQLVELMGGQIGAESQEGKGSAFWFTAVLEKQPPPSAPVTDMESNLRDVKVLVVDDNATNRSLVCRILNSWGSRPEGSADGNSALAILRQAAQRADPFQIALLDTSLPGMNGEELGRRIAADPQLRQTALVLMTSFCRRRQSDWATLQALGFAGQVSKPIWERSLREALLALSAKPIAAVSSTAEFHSPPSPVPAIRSLRILVAEDNLTNQEVAVAMLNKLGHRAKLVANGLEALLALRESDFDLVLMDCEMPEVDGYEATRRIRERQTGTRNPDIPIIALTADAMPEDRDKCLRVGMNDYLAKPVEPRQLAAALKKWLIPPADGEVSPRAGQSPAKTMVVFDREELLYRLMGDQDLASKVVTGFLKNVPQQLRTLKGQLAASDAQGARLQAHALKGAAATVSAEVLQALCSEAEKAAAGGELSRALALLPRLEEQFELLQATLNQSGWV
jgi:PAS domain S-box-containing protein